MSKQEEQERISSIRSNKFSAPILPMSMLLKICFIIILILINHLTKF